MGTSMVEEKIMVMNTEEIMMKAIVTVEIRNITIMKTSKMSLKKLYYLKKSILIQTQSLKIRIYSIVMLTGKWGL
jgi:hypothetical protein